MGPRILDRHLTAKVTLNLNRLCMGPNQKLKQIKSISTSFLTKQFGPISEISLPLQLAAYVSSNFQKDDSKRNTRTNPLFPPAGTASVCVLSNLKKRVVLIDCGQSN